MVRAKVLHTYCRWIPISAFCLDHVDFWFLSGFIWRNSLARLVVHNRLPPPCFRPFWDLAGRGGVVLVHRRTCNMEILVMQAPAHRLIGRQGGGRLFQPKSENEALRNIRWRGQCRRPTTVGLRMPGKFTRPNPCLFLSHYAQVLDLKGVFAFECCMIRSNCRLEFAIAGAFKALQSLMECIYRQDAMRKW